eukprot:4218670-Pleurochrysis_carterae.AAC.1
MLASGAEYASRFCLKSDKGTNASLRRLSEAAGVGGNEGARKSGGSCRSRCLRIRSTVRAAERGGSASRERC